MKNKVLFIGSKSIGYQCLQLIYNLDPNVLIGVMTIDDSYDSRSVYKSFISFGAENNIPIYIAQNKKHSEQIITDLKPNFAFVIGWYWIFSKKIIDFVKNRVLGIHNSLLPKYRGGAPLVWAVINGEEQTGLSLFSITEGMDDGPIWDQKKFNIKPSQYISDLLKISEGEALKLLKKNYLKILNNKIKPSIQDHLKATYCTIRIPEDGLINWKKSAKDIFNFIRAQAPPYPGAYTVLNDKKIIIANSEIFNLTHYGTPGQVAAVNKKNVIIICGKNSALSINEVILETTTFNASEIFNSIKIRL